MMLLIGMNNSLIKNPITPITKNPIAQENAIFENSGLNKTTFFIWLIAFVQEAQRVFGEVSES